MEETAVKTRKAESAAVIARRLETFLQVTREDEAKLMRIIEVRRLKRRARKVPPTR